jgi:hypothetical protein
MRAYVLELYEYANSYILHVTLTTTGQSVVE